MAHETRSFAPLDLAQLVAVPLIWGANNVAAMLALRELPPLFVAGARFSIVFSCLFWLLRPPPRGSVWLFLAMLACVGPIHFGVQYAGLGLARDLAPMVAGSGRARERLALGGRWRRFCRCCEHDVRSGRVHADRRSRARSSSCLLLWL